MSRRSDYFALGTGFLVVIGVIVSLNGNFYNAAQAASPVRSYSFWTAPEMDVCYVLLPLAIYCFVAGFANLPFPPWARPGFPDLEIDITQSWHKGYPLGDRSNLWIALYLRVTSHETDRNASISFYYRAKLDPNTDWGRRFGETLFSGDLSKDRPDDFPAEWLARPLNVLPQHSYGGYFVAKVDSTWRSFLASPLEESLLVEDHNSNSAVAITLPTGGGLFNAGNWDALSRDPQGYWTVYPTPSVAPSDSTEQS